MRIAAALRREAAVRTSALLTERRLHRARGRLLLGPFLGEIGYELLYWIPFLRRELSRHGIDRERVTVMTRGGAGLWYRDFAANELDLFQLLTPEEYLPRLEQRRARAGDLKQLRGDPFDDELTQLARERLGEVAVIRPSLMFARLRGLWFKGEPLERLWPRVEYRRLDVPADPVAGLPDEYIAVKAYFNEVLPATPEIRRFLRAAVERLAEHVDVVLLSTGLAVDDHEEWAAAHERVHPIEHLLRPEDNLAVQTRIIAAARGLVATFGGFSYLGPFLGVPTLTFQEVEQTVPVHLEVLRGALPEADYTCVRAGDEAAVEAFVSAISARSRSTSPRASS